MRRGFTLVEVNLAIFVMAAGTLSMCALYGLGYRENRQSEEDVYATAYADAVLAPLVAGLSSPLLKWNDWLEIGEQPSSAALEVGVDGRWPAQGWRDYVTTQTQDNETHYRVIANPKARADGVFGQIRSVAAKGGLSPASPPSPPSGYQYALVVTRCGTVVQLAFRMARRTQSLMSQPVIVAEVRFQGGFAEDDR